MPLFPKNVVHFGIFTNEMECEKGKQDSFLLQQESLYFSTKMPGKRVSKNIIQLVYFNYYKGKSAKENVDMFSLKMRTVYNKTEKEGRLDIKGSTGRPKKMTQRVERKINKTVYDSQQSCTRGLALQVEKDLVLHISHETIRNVLEKHKYSSRVARKKPLLSAQNVEKRLRFAIEHVSLSFGVLG